MSKNGSPTTGVTVVDSEFLFHAFPAHDTNDIIPSEQDYVFLGFPR
jgi:hypothetical protein